VEELSAGSEADCGGFYQSFAGWKGLLRATTRFGIVPDRHGCGPVEAYRSVAATRAGHL
jgi:hypothetical protein